MKIKTDFITNSSSTAFVVLWPCKITTLEDVSKYIKRNAFANIIFKDAQKQKTRPLNSKMVKKIASEISSGYVQDIPDCWDHMELFCKREGVTEDEVRRNPIWRRQQSIEYDFIINDASTKKAKEFINGKEGYVYFFEYGDESGGIYAELEHNNDWGGLPCLRISHH